jgi:hypothetical protein
MFTIEAPTPTAAPDDLPAAAGPYLVAAPNPFNPRTTLGFALGRGGDVQLEVLDLMGRRVAQLVAEPLAAGRHEVTWDGRDRAGRPLPSGTYLARLQTPDGVATGKLVLAR